MAAMLVTKPSFQLFSFKNISIILLVAFLCSFFTHTLEHELNLNANEILDCQLCQHNVDTPKQIELLTEVTHTSYFVVVTKSNTPSFSTNYFNFPEARGPPNIRKFYT